MLPLQLGKTVPSRPDNDSYDAVQRQDSEFLIALRAPTGNQRRGINEETEYLFLRAFLIDRLLLLVLRFRARLVVVHWLVMSRFAHWHLVHSRFSTICVR